MKSIWVNLNLWVSKITEILEIETPVVESRFVIQGNRPVEFEIRSGLVGPGEPSTILQTMQVIVRTDVPNKMAIEIEPSIPITNLFRKSRSDKLTDLFSFTSKPSSHLSEILRERWVQEGLNSIQFNYIMIQDNEFKMALPKPILNRKKMVGIAQFVNKFIDTLVERADSLNSDSYQVKS